MIQKEKTFLVLNTNDETSLSGVYFSKAVGVHIFDDIDAVNEHLSDTAVLSALPEVFLASTQVQYGISMPAERLIPACHDIDKRILLRSEFDPHYGILFFNAPGIVDRQKTSKDRKKLLTKQIFEVLTSFHHSKFSSSLTIEDIYLFFGTYLLVVPTVPEEEIDEETVFRIEQILEE